MGFLAMRNMLMEQHHWDRRIATLATRLYKGVDTPAALASVKLGEWGYTLLTEGEYRTICAAW